MGVCDLQRDLYTKQVGPLNYTKNIPQTITTLESGHINMA